MSARTPPQFSMSLEEIAKRLGISKQSVQRIEQRAMRKLRRAIGLRADGTRRASP